MINKYPTFSNLDIELKQTIKSYVSRFEPYSDFNFTSLLCWDVDNTACVSMLNDNLIIKIPDYITGDPVISVLGNKYIDETVQTLLDHHGEIKLVPSIVVDNLLSKSNLKIKEDPDNHDYVYSLEDITQLKGQGYKKLRNKINSFKKLHAEYSIGEFDTKSAQETKVHQRIFLEWALIKDENHDEVSVESKAIDRFIENADELDLICFEMKIEGKSIGFSINEVLGDGEYAVTHFQKTLHTYHNADAMLTHSSAESIKRLGCKLVNWEQDLGVLGMRQLKKSYRPVNYLKKYVITRD